MRALLFLPLVFAAAPAPSCEPATRCTEDMDCWRCESMGNRICGPEMQTPTTTPPVTVVLS